MNKHYLGSNARRRTDQYSNYHFKLFHILLSDKYLLSSELY